MASAVSEAGLSVAVPTCPGWTIGRLVAHTGTVHRWATEIVATRATAPVDRHGLDMGFPDEGSGWGAWLEAGAVPLMAAADAARDNRAPGGRGGRLGRGAGRRPGSGGGRDRRVPLDPAGRAAAPGTAGVAAGRRVAAPARHGFRRRVADPVSRPRPRPRDRVVTRAREG